MILLSDAYLANGAEPGGSPTWTRSPGRPPVRLAPNHTDADGTESFWPYVRDRRPGTPLGAAGLPGLEHRIGGLEKSDDQGTVSYDAANHERMTRLRHDRIARHRSDHPRRRGRRPERVGDDARRRLGLDGRGDRRGGRAPRRAARTSPAPSSCTSTPSRPTSARCSRATTGCSSRAQPGPARPALAGRVPGRRHALSKVQGLPFRASELEAAIRAHWEAPPMTQVDDPDDAQGLDERPGGAVVPGLRGLLDPGGPPDAHARARGPPRDDRLRLGDRLRGAASRTT